MGVERDGAACTVWAAHDQVGNGLQTRALDQLVGNGVALGCQSHGVQQVGSALGVWCVIAWRGIGGNLNELLQELHLLVKVRVNPGVKLFVVVHGCSSQKHRAEGAGLRVALAPES